MSTRGYVEGYRTCAVCGKRFWVSDISSWTYKRKGPRQTWLVWFCSYSCKRQYDAEHPPKYYTHDPGEFYDPDYEESERTNRKP